MKFSYSTVILATSDNGHFYAFRRPEIPAWIIGPTGRAEVVGLVDTGSDRTIFPKSIGDALQIEMTASDEPPAKAFTGEEIRLLTGEAVLELIVERERLTWSAVISFYDAPSADNDTIILGHAGFLDYFTATFDGLNAVLTLEPNAELPSAIDGA